ncbi:MAG: succinyl-diaminopimelate desuccinylase [SAR324 cluster bacterium]|nr:succinyl-diaminopimelate desuccinylase [SAR324 cluster bacterium]
MTELELRLMEILQIHSPTGEEQKMTVYIHRLLKDKAKILLTQNGLSLIYRSAQDGEKKTLGLFGHIDTIKAEFPESEETSDKIIGLGSSDMKGGVAIMLELLRNFDPSRSKFNLIFTFYDREEGPYDENGLGPVLERFPFLQNIDLALILEPTDNKLQIGCLGALHALVTFEGKAAHSARPWLGENAIHKAWPLLKKLSELERKEVTQDSLTFYEVINATTTTTINTRNTIPGDFVLNLNYRFAPGKNIEEAKAELVEFIGDGCKIDFVDECPSAPVIATNPILQELQKEFELDIEPKQAWTDIARLSLYNIPAANFGPGQAAQAHKKGEFIEKKSLSESYQIFQKFIYGKEFEP